MGFDGLGGLGQGDAGMLAAGAQPGAVRGWRRVGDEPVDLSGDVAFQAADDLFSVLAFGFSFGHIGLGAGIVVHPGGRDPP